MAKTIDISEPNFSDPTRVLSIKPFTGYKITVKPKDKNSDKKVEFFAISITGRHSAIQTTQTHCFWMLAEDYKQVLALKKERVEVFACDMTSRALQANEEFVHAPFVKPDRNSPAESLITITKMTKRSKKYKSYMSRFFNYIEIKRGVFGLGCSTLDNIAVYTKPEYIDKIYQDCGKRIKDALQKPKQKPKETSVAK